MYTTRTWPAAITKQENLMRSVLLWLLGIPIPIIILIAIFT